MSAPSSSTIPPPGDDPGDSQDCESTSIRRANVRHVASLEANDSAPRKEVVAVFGSRVVVNPELPCRLSARAAKFHNQICRTITNTDIETERYNTLGDGDTVTNSDFGQKSWWGFVDFVRRVIPTFPARFTEEELAWIEDPESHEATDAAMYINQHRLWKRVCLRFKGDYSDGRSEGDPTDVTDLFAEVLEEAKEACGVPVRYVYFLQRAILFTPTSTRESGGEVRLQSSGITLGGLQEQSFAGRGRRENQDKVGVRGSYYLRMYVLIEKMFGLRVEEDRRSTITGIVSQVQQHLDRVKHGPLSEYERQLVSTIRENFPRLHRNTLDYICAVSICRSEMSRYRTATKKFSSMNLKEHRVPRSDDVAMIYRKGLNHKLPIAILFGTKVLLYSEDKEGVPFYAAYLSTSIYVQQYDFLERLLAFFFSSTVIGEQFDLSPFYDQILKPVLLELVDQGGLLTSLVDTARSFVYTSRAAEGYAKKRAKTSVMHAEGHSVEECEKFLREELGKVITALKLVTEKDGVHYRRALSSLFSFCKSALPYSIPQLRTFTKKPLEMYSHIKQLPKVLRLKTPLIATAMAFSRVSDTTEFLCEGGDAYNAVLWAFQYFQTTPDNCLVPSIDVLMANRDHFLEYERLCEAFALMIYCNEAASRYET